MKALRKVILAMLIISMLITSSAFAAPTFSDVDETNPNQKAIEVLAALDLLEGDTDGTFRPNDTITRAELATLSTRMKGLDSIVSASSGETGFSDVATDHWAAKYIQVARDQGIVDGYPDGTFRPDEPITYEQVIKLMVEVCGRGPEAENNNGYPYGYITVATMNSMLDDLGSVLYTDEAPRGAVAQMAYNTLDVDLMEPVAIDGHGDTQYDVLEGQNIMTNYLNLQKNEGIVMGYGATKLYDSVPNFDADEAVISNSVYKVGDLDLAEFVGSEVEYYYRVDRTANTNTLLYVAADENQTIVTVTPETKGYTSNLATDGWMYTYYANLETARTRTINVDPNATVVYNNAGVSSSSLSNDLFDIEQGSIKWYDTDNNSVYDLVIIKNYKTYAVSSVNTNDLTLTFKENSESRNSIVLHDPVSEPDYRVTYLYGGTSATFSDISKDSVVSIAESRDGFAIEIVISDETVTGTVDEISTDVNGNPVYRIGDTEYSVTAQLSGTPELNREATFYLSYDGKIAYIPEVSTDISSYVFLLQARNTTTGLSKGVDIEVLTTANERKTYHVADTVSHNGDTISSTELYNEHLMIEDPNSAGTMLVDRDLISIELNGKGEIITLNTRVIIDPDPTSGTAAGTEDPTLYPIPEDALTGMTVTDVSQLDYENPVTFKYLQTGRGSADFDRRWASIPYNITYRPDDNFSSFMSLFYLDVANTRVYVINTSNLYELSKASASELSSLISCMSVGEVGYGWNSYYDIMPYNVDENQICPTLLQFGGSSSINYGSAMFVVDSWYETVVGDDMMDTVILRGYQNMREVEYTVSPDDPTIIDMAKNSTKGDILWLAMNTSNQIVNMVPAVMITTEANYNYNKPGTQLGSKDDYSSRNLSSLGEVDKFGNTQEGGDHEVIFSQIVEVDLDSNMVVGRMTGDMNTASVEDKYKPFRPIPNNITMIEVTNLGEADQEVRISVVSSSMIEVGDYLLNRSIYDGVQEAYLFKLN